MEFISEVRSDNTLVIFLYLLMTEGLHPQQLARAVDLVRAVKANPEYTKHGVVRMANGPLALMAQEAARELVGEGTIANGGEHRVHEKEVHGQEGQPQGEPAEPCAAVAAGTVGEPERQAQG